MQAAIRILPSVVVGVALNFTTGIVVHRVPVVWLVVITSVLSSGAPLLMAFIQAQWTYWTSAFFAQVLMPFSVDVLLTVGLIAITAAFPEDRQSIAGAVFNTAAQFGSSLGLAVMQVISTIVTKSNYSLRPSEALLEGYRASFWTMFAFMVSSAVIGTMGLRKTGKIGLKQD
jgi:MFS family permease